jgi:copper/silver efflux system protein
MRKCCPSAGWQRAAVVLAGLVPIMVGHRAGSEVIQRIAASTVGGMITAPLLSMFVIPAA